MLPITLTLATLFAVPTALAYSFERSIDTLFPVRRDSIDNDNSTVWPARTCLFLCSITVHALTSTFQRLLMEEKLGVPLSRKQTP